MFVLIEVTLLAALVVVKIPGTLAIELITEIEICVVIVSVVELEDCAACNANASASVVFAYGLLNFATQ